MSDTATRTQPTFCVRDNARRCVYTIPQLHKVIIQVIFISIKWYQRKLAYTISACLSRLKHTGIPTICPHCRTLWYVHCCALLLNAARKQVLPSRINKSALFLLLRKNVLLVCGIVILRAAQPDGHGSNCLILKNYYTYFFPTQFIQLLSKTSPLIN